MVSPTAGRAVLRLALDSQGSLFECVADFFRGEELADHLADGGRDFGGVMSYGVHEASPEIVGAFERLTVGNIKALFAQSALYSSSATGSLPLPCPPVAEPLGGRTECIG